MMFTIRMGRRPYRSASQPKKSAPTGRKASVRKMPSETAFTVVWNSPEIDFSAKTKMKKSNASSAQPAREAAKACRWDVFRPRNASSMVRSDTQATCGNARRSCARDV
jgi:hypothetical protein